MEAKILPTLMVLFSTSLGVCIAIIGSQVIGPLMAAIVAILLTFSMILAIPNG